MKDFIHQFEEHPAPKISCPKCGHKKCFRKYKNLPRDYGKCERINSCGYHNIPNGQMNGGHYPPTATTVPAVPEIEYKIIYPEEALCSTVIANQTSMFHEVCKNKLSIADEHFKKWNIGSRGTETAFVYMDINKQPLNIRFVEYDERCNRSKEKTPYSLSAKNYSKYKLCLFGEHLLTDKTVCLVESEKTAFIASHYYPQFDWLATGSRNGLTDDKISVLQNRQVLFLPDADVAGRENSSIKTLERHSINFNFIDLFPDRNDGYDLADAIFDGLHPEIKLNDKVPEPVQVKQVAGAKTSLFERVEKFISDEYELRYNEVSNEIECKSKDSEKKDEDYRAMNENNLFRFLQHNNIKISLSNLGALLRSDFVPVFNPFTDYFDGLRTWDEKTEPDYIDKVSEYVKAKEPERFKIQFKKMLVRCIACALKDGYFNKHAFILVQDFQNSGKSTFCRWLCPPALGNYIAENISTDKDSRIALAENLIINLDELATMNKADMNSLKSLFSKDKIKDRPPFGKKQVVMPRRASFFGSTDRTEFLTDEAGSVRWLCFQLAEKINWAYKKDIDINDLWRQAYTLYNSGYKYDLSADEIKENESVNKSFRVSTSEMELIPNVFLPGTTELYDEFFTATDILNYLIQKYPNIKLSQVNIGKALKTLGFLQGQKRVNENDYPIKGYYLKYK